MKLPGWVAPVWQSSTLPPGHGICTDVVSSGGVTVSVDGIHAPLASQAESGPARKVRTACARPPGTRLTRAGFAGVRTKSTGRAPAAPNSVPGKPSNEHGCDDAFVKTIGTWY